MNLVESSGQSQALYDVFWQLKQHLLIKLSPRSQFQLWSSDCGVNVDKNHHQQIEDGTNDAQYRQDSLLSIILWILDVPARMGMAMGEHL